MDVANDFLKQALGQAAVQYVSDEHEVNKPGGIKLLAVIKSSRILSDIEDVLTGINIDGKAVD